MASCSIPNAIKAGPESSVTTPPEFFDSSDGEYSYFVAASKDGDAVWRTDGSNVEMFFPSASRILHLSDDGVFFVQEDTEVTHLFFAEHATAPIEGNLAFSNLQFAVFHDDGAHGREPWIVSVNNGDVTRNGRVDFSDLARMCDSHAAGSQQWTFDLDRDGAFNLADVRALQDWLEIPTGDISGDGRFDSTDLVRLFQNDQFSDDIANNSRWSTGDWNCDGDFDTADLVLAFQEGGYSTGVDADRLDVIASAIEFSRALRDQDAPGRSIALTVPTEK